MAWTTVTGGGAGRLSTVAAGSLALASTVVVTSPGWITWTTIVGVGGLVRGEGIPGAGHLRRGAAARPRLVGVCGDERHAGPRRVHDRHPGSRLAGVLQRHRVGERGADGRRRRNHRGLDDDIGRGRRLRRPRREGGRGCRRGRGGRRRRRDGRALVVVVVVVAVLVVVVVVAVLVVGAVVVVEGVVVTVDAAVLVGVGVVPSASSAEGAAATT